MKDTNVPVAKKIMEAMWNYRRDNISRETGRMKDTYVMQIGYDAFRQLASHPEFKFYYRNDFRNGEHTMYFNDFRIVETDIRGIMLTVENQMDLISRDEPHETFRKITL